MRPADRPSPAAPAFPPVRMPESPDRAKPTVHRQRPSRRTRNFFGSAADHLSFSWLLASSASLQLLRRALNGFANSHVRRAAAEIAAHRFFNILVCGFGRRLQQRNRAHDLSALAVATLDDVFFHPG